MSTSSKAKSRKGLYLTLFVGLWIAIALGAVYYVKPDFWKDSHDYYIKAQELEKEGRIDAARESLAKALEAQPDNPGYLVYRGSLAEKAGDLDAASQSYARALELAPKDAEAALGLGKVLLEQGKEQQALETLLTLDAEELETPLLERRAGLLAEKGQHEQAVQDFRALVARQPETSGYKRQLAASLMALEQWAEAEEVLADYMQQAPDQAAEQWARQELTIALRAQKKLEETYDLLASHPTRENLRTRAEIALEMGRFEEAAPLFRQLVEQNPHDPELKNKLAVSLRAAGSLDEAYEVYKESPQQQNLAEKAQLAMQLENFEDAARDYAQLLAKGPQEPEYRENLVIALRELGRLEEAYELLQEAPSEENLDERAQLAMQLEKFDDAIRLYKQLEAKRPDDEEVKNQLAVALRAHDRLEEALASFSAAPSEENLDERAQLAMQLEKFDQAIELYKELLREQPDNDQARQELAVALRAAGRLEEAYDLYQAIASEENLAIRAQLAMQLERFSEAAALYKKVLERMPETPGASENLAVALRAGERLEEAFSVFSQAPSPDNLDERAQLAMQLKKFDQAAELYAQLAKQRPDDPEVARQLAMALRASGELQQAYELYQSIASEENLAARAQLAMQLERFDEAVEHYRELLQQEPDHPEAAENLAVALRATDRLEEAYRLFTEQADEDNLAIRAQLALQLEKFDEAARLLRQLVEREPDNATAKRDLALALRAAGRLEEAYQGYTSVASDDNLAIRAQLALQLERFDEAASLYRELAEKKPGNIEAQRGLAIALRATERLEEAYRVFNQAPSEENLRPRAELALQLEKFAEAARLYGQLAKKHPDDTAIREQLAYALDKAQAAEEAVQTAEAEMGTDTAPAAEAPESEPEPKIEAAAEGPSAAAEYEALVASDKASPETRIRYAWLLMRRQAYDRAYEVLAPLPDDDLETLQLKAEAAFLAQRMEEAVPLLEKLTSRQPENAKAWRNLADARDALQKPGAAAEAMHRVVALLPDDIAAKARLAGLLERSGKKREAEKLFRDVLAQDPDNITALSELATLYESRGQYDSALQLLHRLQKLQPSGEYVRRIARIYVWKKDLQAARQWYGRYLAMNPPASRRVQALTDLAEAHVDGGEPQRGLEYLDRLNASQSRSPKLLTLLGRAAMQTGKPQIAVAALERLDGLRGLQRQEQLWLAGQYRLLGQNAKALALYRKADENAPLRTAGDLEALGDLLLDAGEPAAALAAYDRIPAASLDAGLQLKIARAADRSGQKRRALQAYEKFAAAGVTDPELLLETARFMVNVGRYDKAMQLYDKALAARGPQGLQLELTLANLAAKRYAQAEQWARKAISAGDGGWKAKLALVQALHLQGRSAAADTLLRENKDVFMAHREGKEWMGYVAVARDRQLQAFKIFDELIKQGHGDIGKFWLWRGIAATRRGDFSRAAESFAQAKRYGKTPPAGIEAN